MAAKTRSASPGKRHRQPNGPEEFQVSPVAPPSLKDVGTAHVYAQDALSGGPRALIAAQREAAQLSQRFGEEIEEKWCLATPWLSQLTLTHRARAQYALRWRPRFLAVVALTHSLMFGCKAARVTHATMNKHRREDPDFDAQVLAAQDRAIELLHDVTMKEALEGRVEPVYWQGIEVGHIIKTDNRLRIEMLRAHMPDKFKTPGAKVAINNNNGVQNFAIIDEAARNGLVELRQAALREIAAGRAAAAQPLQLSESTVDERVT